MAAVLVKSVETVHVLLVSEMNISHQIRPVKLIHVLRMVCARVKSVKMMMELLNVLNVSKFVVIVQARPSLKIWKVILHRNKAKPENLKSHFAPQ